MDTRSLILRMSPEQMAEADARLRAAMEAAENWNPADQPGIVLALRPALPCPDGDGLLVCGDCSHRGFTRQHLTADGVCPYGHRAPAEGER